MPDQMNIIGVPGIDANGNITPFSPNPPWLTTDVTFYPNCINDSGFPIEWFIDTFGALHVRGQVNFVATGAPILGQALFSIQVGAAIPTRANYVTKTPFPGSYPIEPMAFNDVKILIDTTGISTIFQLESAYDIYNIANLSFDCLVIDR